ncbi:SEC-C metal-binding domain-containing protein [Sorangium sp. So ce1335]|uniref:SEC-C metal-binding domain-containing protein n=1 Tax=Sorangium sp. So ce1335 TaxID=3133335 RepID=UPI003F62FF49
MRKVGRNEPCPCGSGRKHKRCCLANGGGAPYTSADRQAALQRVLLSSHPDDIDHARERFWGKHSPLRDRWTDDVALEMAEVAFQFWLIFDFDAFREGVTLAEETLQNDPDLGQGERRYLEMGRATSMRLYEVVHVVPGASVTLRDVLHGGEVRVRERSASRALHAWDLVAARVMPKGASGEPEIDGGLFPIQSRLRDRLVQLLTALSAELDEAALREARVPAFFDAWISPGLPQLVNYDGDPMILTHVRFDVTDEGKLVAALDGARDLCRDSGAQVWSWVGKGAQRSEAVCRAFLRIEQGRLEIETNSRERGEAARALVERLAGAAATYRITEHQDLEQAMLAHPRGEAGGAPAPAPEALRQAAVQMLQQHYEKWLDEPVPALDGLTPHAAASVDGMRPRVAALIEGLERLYERALAEGAAAFDPTWMWEELGLEDLARGRSRKQAVQRLPHEVIEELAPDLVEVAADIGERARRTSREDLTRTIDRQEVEGDLGFRRLVRGSVQAAEGGAAPEPDAAAGRASLASWVESLSNFELHLRKVFWVDEGLSWMLGATALDVTGEALRPPFASFALVFTDRYALGLAERLLAEDPSARLRGRILSVLTVYVTATADGAGPRDLRLAFAADARDGGWPELVVRELSVRQDARIVDLLRTLSPGDEPGEEVETLIGSPPLRGLVGLVINAILYATSADAEAVPGDPRGADAPPPRRRRRDGAIPPTNGIFRLPGKIDVTSLKQLKRVRRGASEVQAIRRCMVRGHWRRAGRSWKDASPRWIKPYWRGPSAAAIVEREYRLTRSRGADT